MSFKKGQSGNPRGRPKGIRNKIPTSLKEDILEVYQNLGGKAGLEKWARASQRNLAMFYQWTIAKLLPNVASIVGEQNDLGDFKPLQIIVTTDGNKPDSSA